MLTLSLLKLDFIAARMNSNGLLFSGGTSVDIRLVIVLLLLLSMLVNQALVKKLKRSDNHNCIKYILPYKKLYSLTDICGTLFDRSVNFCSTSK